MAVLYTRNLWHFLTTEREEQLEVKVDNFHPTENSVKTFNTIFQVRLSDTFPDYKERT